MDAPLGAADQHDHGHAMQGHHREVGLNHRIVDPHDKGSCDLIDDLQREEHQRDLNRDMRRPKPARSSA